MQYKMYKHPNFHSPNISPISISASSSLGASSTLASTLAEDWAGALDLLLAAADLAYRFINILKNGYVI
jgi:hypothetical protein